MTLSRRTSTNSIWRRENAFHLHRWALAAPPKLLIATSIAWSLLQPEEALAAAISEFGSQGVDLSNVITSLAGGNITDHPAAVAVREVDSCLLSGDLQGAMGALAALDSALDAAAVCGDEAQVGVVAHKAEAGRAAVRCLSAATPAVPAAQAAALRTLLRLLPLSADHRQAFRQASGPAAVAVALQTAAADDAELLAIALETAAASGTKDEDGKAAIVEAGLGGAAISALNSHRDTSPEVVCSACAVLSTLTNPDDESKPSSRCRLACPAPAAKLPARAGADRAAVH